MLRALILVLALAGAWLAAPANAAPAGSNSLNMSFKNFFADEAGVFSASFVEETRRRLQAVHDKSGVTIIVASAPSLQGADTAKLARRIGEGFEQAKQAHPNWAVFVLAPVEREFSFAFASDNKAAGDAIRTMEDTEKEQLLREVGSALSEAVVPFFKDNNWEAGMRAGIDAIERQLGKAPSPAPATNTPAPAEEAV